MTDTPSNSLVEDMARAIMELNPNRVPTIEQLAEACASVLKNRLSEDDCAICGKTRKQHSTASGYGVCQVYPIFVSRREMVERIMVLSGGKG